jgi:hypothetical protein
MASGFIEQILKTYIPLFMGFENVFYISTSYPNRKRKCYQPRGCTYDISVALKQELNVV